MRELQGFVLYKCTAARAMQDNPWICLSLGSQIHSQWCHLNLCRLGFNSYTQIMLRCYAMFPKEYLRHDDHENTTCKKFHHLTFTKKKTLSKSERFLTIVRLEIIHNMTYFEANSSHRACQNVFSTTLRKLLFTL